MFEVVEVISQLESCGLDVSRGFLHFCHKFAPEKVDLEELIDKDFLSMPLIRCLVNKPAESEIFVISIGTYVMKIKPCLTWTNLK